MNIKTAYNVAESLTPAHAKAWNATSEKLLFIIDDLGTEFDFHLSANANNFEHVVEIIERKLEDIAKRDVTAEVGEGVTMIHFSDRQAGTVIARTAKTIKVQRDTATLLNGANSDAEDKLTVTAGGFLAHFEGKQRYTYEANPEGYVSVYTLRKNGRWILQGESINSRARLVDGRNEHYDYNF